MAAKTNSRTDKYGGNLHNRMRFLLEVVDAVAAEVRCKYHALHIYLSGSGLVFLCGTALYLAQRIYTNLRHH